MNGLGITIIVGQLPKLFGFSTHADSFLAELRAFVENLGQTHTATLIVGLVVLAVLLVLPRITRRLPAVLVAVVGATLVSAVFGLAATRRCDRGGSATGGPHAVDPVDQGERCSPAADRRMGDHARVAHRHDRDRDELRGPPW